MKHYCGKCLKAYDSHDDSRECCPLTIAAAIDESLVNDRRAGMFERTLGLKKDQGKVRWSLLPKGVITTILQVLEFGATKYAVDNWQHVEDHERRYYDATMRHIEAWRAKETNDPESGLPHLAHAVCCLMFLMWFDGRSVVPSHAKDGDQ